MASRPPTAAPAVVAAKDTTDDFAVGGEEGAAGEWKRDKREEKRREARANARRLRFRFFNSTHPSPPPKPSPTAPSVRSSAAAAAAQQQETDPRRLEQRQKQIDFGKNTRGYQRYSAAVPR